jgi:hypothetical protein
MIFANDNLVGGAAGAGLLLGATGVLVCVWGDDGCLAAASFTSLFVAFGLVFSTPVTDA